MVCPMLLGSCVVHGGWFVHQQTAGSDGREEKGNELAAAVCTPLTTTSLHPLLHRHLSTVRSAKHRWFTAGQRPQISLQHATMKYNTVAVL